MAATNSEVSKKIRAAIKAKLEELGVYVDEELPDYIMVMIANKKEKTQMKDDLQLFLGKNAAKFVDWLFDIFERLQTIGASSSSSNVGLNMADSSSQSKRSKDVEGGGKNAEKQHRDENGEEKQKRERKHRESDERSKDMAREKEFEKTKEKSREHEKERDEKAKKRDRYEAKVVKSKRPSLSSTHHNDEHSAVEVSSSSHQRTNTRKKADHSASTHHTRKESVSSSSSKREEEKKVVEKMTRKEERKVAKEKILEHKSEEKRAKEKTDKVEKRKLREKDKDKEKEKEKEKHESPRDEPRKVVPQPNSSSRDLAPKESRKRRISPIKALSPDYEEKASAAYEEPVVVKQPPPPKVSSVAVSKMSLIEQPKTISSQIIVKRKLPDKESSKQQSNGVKSLFLKAIKEAGQTTRIASQSAGYGAGLASHKKDSGAMAPEMSRPAKMRDEDELSVVEDEGIEIDDYGDIDDALVVMPTATTSTAAAGGGRSAVNEHKRAVIHKATDSDNDNDDDREIDECGGSEQEIETVAHKRRRIMAAGMNVKKEEPKFYVTMNGQRISAMSGGLSKLKVVAGAAAAAGTDDGRKEPERPKKRRNETNPILAHLNLTDERSSRRASAMEKSERAQKKSKRESKIVLQEGVENDPAVTSDGVVLSEGSLESRRTPVWDGQIQLAEEDDSSDDEAQIDAVLASTQTVSVGFDEVPPTPTLTKPAFFLPQNQSQSGVRSSAKSSAAGSVVAINGEKLMERCKFWPNCRLEESCIYIHPTKPCGNFPNCHFGERCLYIHPLCKFDRTCSNPRCPFTHSPKLTVTTTVASVTSAPPPPTTTTDDTAVSPITTIANTTTGESTTTSSALSSPLSSSIPCKFGGRCANPNCAFKHPKLCRFGERCTNRACYFWHPQLNIATTTVAKYKWKAPAAT